jgi:predicted glycosyltransferase involved in capsule biosynthesis
MVAISKLTAIIPIDLSQRPADIIQKARWIAEAAVEHGVTIVFGHNITGSADDQKFTASVAGFPGVTIAAGRFYTDAINTSALRNEAFKLVDTEFLLLLDVDIWSDFGLIDKYLAKVMNHERGFHMLPCLYLTKLGSELLVQRKIDAANLKERFFNYSRKEFLHLASPSSVTVLRTSHYAELGGFDESFTGHGYEDFDFLVRLAAHNNEFQPCSDLLDNKTARSPLFATGFRRYLGESCLGALLEKDMVFHIYHDKPKTKYYAARSTNYELFAQRHGHRAGSQSPTDSTLITAFSTLCHEQKKDIHGLSVLFDNKPGHIDRFDTFKRRLRFLLNE